MQFCRVASRLIGGLIATAIIFSAIRTDVQADDPASGKKLALLVGTNQYNHAKLDPLQFAERDVDELSTVLKGQGYTVVLLTPALGKKNPKLAPNRKNIEDRLQELLAGTGRNDQILIGFAGHGIQPDGSSDSYYCPFDANPSVAPGSGTEPSKVMYPDTLVAITGKNGILRMLDTSGIGRKMLLIDACRNDPESGRGSGVGSGITELPDRTWVLLSCSARQRAWETGKLGGGHGVFFHFVLEGMRGKAADSSGEVTWNQLAQYVMRQVEKSVPDVIGDGATQSPDEKKSGSGIPVLASVAPVRPPTLPSSTSPTPKYVFPEKITSKIGLQLCLIPEGDFQMGNEDSVEELTQLFPKMSKNRFQNAAPRHPVKITRPFYLGKFEVTRGEFQKFIEETGEKSEAEADGQGGYGYIGDKIRNFEIRPEFTWRNPGFEQGDDHPVVNVSWNDAIKFCAWLSKKDGRVYRLPTEAEWEYACRAGTTSHFNTGDKPEQLPASANIQDLTLKEKSPNLTLSKAIERRDGFAFTSPCGKFVQNSWGLHDMHGNVWEWCSDWYDESYYGKSSIKDPQGPESGTARLHRGGGWFFRPAFCRSAFRDNDVPSYRSCHLGFRVASTPTEK